MIKMPLSIESRSNMLFLHSYKNYNFPPLNPKYFNNNVSNRVVELNEFFTQRSNFKYFTQYLITRFKLKKVPFVGKYFKETLRNAVYDYYHLAPIDWFKKNIS
jgi:hypothetical protein